RAQVGPPARDRALGASPLTQRIYQAVLPHRDGLTVKEIWKAIKDIPGVETDTNLWWQRKNSQKASIGYSLDDMGIRRVWERARYLAQDGVLVSDGLTGRGHEAHYTAGRPPKGFRSHKALRPWGWHDIDVEKQISERDRLIARPSFLARAKAEL